MSKFFILALILLTSCATFDIDTFGKLIQNGDCVGARKLLDEHHAYGDGDPGWRDYNRGVIASSCEKNPELAYRYFYKSAEAGNSHAKDALIRANRPLPNDPSYNLHTGNTGGNYTPGTAAPSAICNTTFVGDFAYTNCY